MDQRVERRFDNGPFLPLPAVAVAFAVLWLLVGTVPVECAISFQDLLDGASLTVGDNRFSDWALIDLVFTTPKQPELGQIDVLPLIDDPFNPGVQFNANGQLETTGLAEINLVFSFRVSTLDGGAHIKDNRLELTDFGFEGTGGFVNIFEEVNGTSGGVMASTVVYADNEFSDFVLTDFAEFDPLREIIVTKDIFLSGTVDDSDVVRLNGFTQRFSASGESVPEPSSLAFFCVVLGVLTGARIGWRSYMALASTGSPRVPQ